MLTKKPHTMRRDEFITFKQTLVQVQFAVELPANYSEEELHRVTLTNRNRETMPPIVPKFEIGTWMIWGDMSDLLYRLERIPLSLIMPRETYQSFTTVNKYQTWIQSGSQPPPIRVDKTGVMHSICDGHHRFYASKYEGVEFVLAWVGYYFKEVINGRVYRQPLTYTNCVVSALRRRLNVAQDVIQDAIGIDSIELLQQLPIKTTIAEDINRWQLTTEMENNHLVRRTDVGDNCYLIEASSDGQLIIDAMK